ncbi:hypothetical protein VIN01S_23760 [Vibrio inusitatus NBRC 102082]|uniref:Uncharacterized protein n=1 Tax=Vibrio inusitatus NBRC 102082 TaxID=1219070 RepID=A0A4Y3HY02_9VIBR|nr:hypothetical protein [Vibrio inusitatus]GEA51572.1 hypothetical protein VIN01S_23760 [Vibrio inusitatus NBRC 102082]
MYALWALVAVSLAIALSDDGLIGSIAEAVGFVLVLSIVIKCGRANARKSSRRMMSRIKPSHYDKVL